MDFTIASHIGDILLWIPLDDILIGRVNNHVKHHHFDTVFIFNLIKECSVLVVGVLLLVYPELERRYSWTDFFDLDDVVTQVLVYQKSYPLLAI